ncbi:MAG: TolC family protein [Verrucomicrobiota bacterium]
MNSNDKTRRRCWLTACVCLLLAGVFLTGCKGIPTAGEKQARQQAKTMASVYRPDGRRPALSTLNTNSSLGDFLRFAMLNRPQVEASYYDWLASIERITVERSLPDPRFTFESDITKIVETVMAGLMMDLPGPGKLKARGAVASAESEVKYYVFETGVLQTAFAFKKAYYQLHFLTEKIRVNQQTLELLADIEKIALKQNEVGKVTLQDVLRAQIEQDRMRTEIANLEDSRHPLLAQLKAALGLKAGESDPPWPARFETTPLDLTPDRLLATAFARNPRLKAMEAEVRLAEASIRLATKAKVPDFSAGIEADVRSYPVMVRPSLGVTLPIWRDKIAAEIAAAQAGQRAAESRLSAEQIALAVDLAEKSFMFREASRNLALVQEALLPKARQSLEVARASYLAGKTEFFNLIDAWRTLLDFQLTQVEAQTQRELALAELSLVIAGLPPAQAPILPQASRNAPQPENKNAKKSHAK